MEGIKFMPIAEPRCMGEPSAGYAWKGEDEKYLKKGNSNIGNYGRKLAEYLRATDVYGRAEMRQNYRNPNSGYSVRRNY